MALHISRMIVALVEVNGIRRRWSGTVLPKSRTLKVSGLKKGAPEIVTHSCFAERYLIRLPPLGTRK